MTLSAKRLALALQGIPLLEKCQPMQSDEQPDERSHSPSGQPPPPTKTAVLLPLDYAQYVLILSESCAPMHYRYAFDSRAGSEILRFKPFTSGM